jgi:lambda family phage portal protein
MRPADYSATRSRDPAPRMNIVDQVVSWFSPVRGVQRFRARMALEFVRRYDAAALGRRTDGWGAQGTSANTEIQSGFVRLRDRSRELVRNNPWANRGISAIANNVVSYGFTAKIKGTKATRAKWAAWANSTACDADGRHNLAGMIWLAMRAVPESGEVLIRRRWRKAGDTDTSGKLLPIPMQLQLLEADYLDHSKTELLANGGRIVQGVQFGPFGNREGYWLYADHPGDLVGNIAASAFVPAKDVLHIYRVDRPGQVRGVPWLHPVMLTLRDADDYEDAYLLQQKMAASQVGVIKDSISSGLPTNPVATPPLGETFEAGRFDFLPPGKDITFNTTAPAGEYGPFVKSILLRVAAALGITYQALTGDLTNANFSSGRMGWIEMFLNIDAWRWNMLVPQGYDPIGRWFAEALFIAQPNSQALIDGTTFEWTAPRKQMIQPDKEIAAYKDAVRCGFMTLPQVHRELGEDSEAIFAEIAATNTILDDNSIVLDSDPRKTSGAGQGPAQSPQPATEPDTPVE